MALYLLYTNFKEKADSVYQLMEDIAQELKDTTLWAEALSRQGSIAFMKGNDYLVLLNKSYWMLLQW